MSFFPYSLKNPFLRRIATLSKQPIRNVLGIETSCDDTAVSIVSSQRKILASKKVSDSASISRLGGIHPESSARQHRAHIDRLVEECVVESGLRLSDLDAVAVSTCPGLLICLKVGVDKALALSRDYRLKLVQIHHMRAHAIVCRLLREDIEFPFISLLISGGHALIVVVRSVDKFEVIGESLSGSPGETLDKLARELKLQPPGSHYAVALEQLAKRASPDGHLRFQIALPCVLKADYNFSSIKCSFLSRIRRGDPTAADIPDFCASIQFAVMSHLCKKLDLAFQFLMNIDTDDWDRLKRKGQKWLIVAGGVASNRYFMECIAKVASNYGFQTFSPPPRLCTDNAEMVAWLGIEALISGCDLTSGAYALPADYSIMARCAIGSNVKDQVPDRSPIKFSSLLIHNEREKVV